MLPEETPVRNDLAGSLPAPKADSSDAGLPHDTVGTTPIIATPTPSPIASTVPNPTKKAPSPIVPSPVKTMVTTPNPKATPQTFQHGTFAYNGIAEVFVPTRTSPLTTGTLRNPTVTANLAVQASKAITDASAGIRTSAPAPTPSTFKR